MTSESLEEAVFTGLKTVGTYVNRLVRKIRETPLLLRQSTNETLAVLTTPNDGNYSLDQRFCVNGCGGSRYAQ